MTGPFPLSTVIRPYDWGSTTAFPEMFGTERTGGPQAELWAGAHPSAPSFSGGLPLTELIRRDPVGMLGERAVERFGPVLPFLLKVLAVERPLSLQVHPANDRAAAGFAREENAGIAPDDARRVYRDPRHKPEMVCAVTGFEALCGFRDPRDAAALLDGLGLAETAPWTALLRVGALRRTFERVFEDAAACDAVERALLRSDRDEYAAYRGLALAFPGDPAVTAALLLNHVRLSPGQAMFLGAGVPHAYLAGVAVEVMANSDNVLRCGLTAKRRHLAEALSVLDLRPAEPSLVPATRRQGGVSYQPPVAEFMLTRHDLATGASRPLPPGAPRILLCLGGEARVQRMAFGPGEAAFVPARASLDLTGQGTVHIAEPGTTP
ncbi:mannose-6-phosphate isomerase, class I [Actinomadura kijaniata]|uniref:mannose-6-phosphate isomerase n=1 Tax=Actinomadura namibiensis TaxID=182080 RepID=A0A7W3LKT3_ACTNM|nr:mannose-6-phosphate isomerase, class I [Actinomadura namibiensis]MBA8949954.1 mannose-6-phosphate isomerase [Actinomadura namibiensis]